MADSINLSNTAGTLFRKLETLASDLKCPTALAEFLPNAFSFLIGEKVRILIADSGVCGQLAFVIRSLLNNENIGVKSRYEFNATREIFVESVENLSNTNIPVMADATLLIVDAAQAWTRSQDLFFKNAIEKKLPVCVVLVGLENVDVSEQNEVSEHVESQIKRYGNALLLETENSPGVKLDLVCGEMLRDFLNTTLVPEKVSELRQTTAKSIFSYALNVLRPQMEKLSEQEAKEQKIKSNAIFDAKTQQDGIELSWQTFERAVGNYRRLAENKLRTLFDDKKDRITKDLVYSMSRSQSVKDWWETSFRYELERQLESLSKQADGNLKDLIRKDLVSLAQSANRKFGVPVEFDSEFDQIGLSIPNVGEANLGISGKQRIYIRAGSLIVGSALASTGIGILALGLPNLISEFRMQFFEKKSKAEAEPLICNTTEKAISALFERVEVAVKDVYEKMLSVLKEAHAEWAKSANEKVEKMEETPANIELSALREKCESAFKEITNLIKNI